MLAMSGKFPSAGFKPPLSANGTLHHQPRWVQKEMLRLFPKAFCRATDGACAQSNASETAPEDCVARECTAQARGSQQLPFALAHPPADARARNGSMTIPMTSVTSTFLDNVGACTALLLTHDED